MPTSTVAAIETHYIWNWKTQASINVGSMQRKLLIHQSQILIKIDESKFKVIQ